MVGRSLLRAVAENPLFRELPVTSYMLPSRCRPEGLRNSVQAVDVPHRPYAKVLA